jgi:hypothetical protein
VLLLSACAPIKPTAPPEQLPQSEAAAPRSADLAMYLQTLNDLAPGDPTRQAAALTAAQTEWQTSPSSSTTLRYALALGCAGHSASNPVEAKRILTELLAGPNDLSPAEKQFAEALTREFDARVALYAELARQREEAQRQLTADEAEDARRTNALSAENSRLKKALTEAQRQLEAVTEMERQLLEQAGAAASETPPQR